MCQLFSRCFKDPVWGNRFSWSYAWAERCHLTSYFSFCSIQAISFSQTLYQWESHWNCDVIEDFHLVLLFAAPVSSHHYTQRLRWQVFIDWYFHFLTFCICIWSFHFLTLYVYLVFSLSHLFQATDNGSVNSESVCSKRGKTNQNHCKIQIVWKDSNNLSVSDSNYLTVLDSKYLSVSDSKYLTVLDPRYPTVLVLNIRLFQILNSRDFADHPNPFTEPAGFRGMFPPSLDGPTTPITNILSILLH